MFKILIVSTFISISSSAVYEGGYGVNVIPAAIQTRYTLGIRHVDAPQQPIQPQVVEVNGEKPNIVIIFNSASSRVNVVQRHEPAEVPPVQKSSSEDEPHYLVHQVTKPVIQEVREVISPYRRVVQEIRPVVEVTNTIISRGDKSGRKAVVESEIENILVDKRLYSGSTIYDLKYISPNRALLFNNHSDSSSNILFNMLKVYKDK